MHKGLYLASLAVATVALWGLRPPAARNCFPKSCEQNAKQSGTTYGLFVATNKAKSRAPFSFASRYALALCLAALRLLLLRRTLFESCQKQTRPRLLVVVSVAMQKPSLTLLHVLRRGDLSPSRNERSGLKLDRAMVANVVKLNFATRRRDGFKFKGGSYLIGSDRSRPSRFLLAVVSRAKQLPPPLFFFKKTIPYLPTTCEVAALRVG